MSGSKEEPTAKERRQLAEELAIAQGPTPVGDLGRRADAVYNAMREGIYWGQQVATSRIAADLAAAGCWEGLQVINGMEPLAPFERKPFRFAVSTPKVRTREPCVDCGAEAVAITDGKPRCDTCSDAWHEQNRLREDRRLLIEYLHQLTRIPHHRIVQDDIEEWLIEHCFIEG